MFLFCKALSISLSQREEKPRAPSKYWSYAGGNGVCTFWRMPLRWWNSTYSCRSSAFFTLALFSGTFIRKHTRAVSEWVGFQVTHRGCRSSNTSSTGAAPREYFARLLILFAQRASRIASGSGLPIKIFANDWSLCFGMAERRRRKESGLQKLWRVSTLQACCEIFSIRSILRLPSCGICEKSCLHKKKENAFSHTCCFCAARHNPLFRSYSSLCCLIVGWNLKNKKFQANIFTLCWKRIWVFIHV